MKITIPHKTLPLFIIVLLLNIECLSIRKKKLKMSENNNVVEVNTQEQFQKEVLDNTGKTIVKFYAVWCGACKAAQKPFEELSQELKDVKCVAVNVDQSGDLPRQYKVNGIPHFVIFDNGKEIGRKTGFGSKESLKEMVK